MKKKLIICIMFLIAFVINVDIVHAADEIKTPTFSKISKVNENEVKLSFQNNSICTRCGIEILDLDNNKFYRVDYKTKEHTIKKLTKGKSYRYKISTYYIKNGIYYNSGWSETKTIYIGDNNTGSSDTNNTTTPGDNNVSSSKPVISFSMNKEKTSDGYYKTSSSSRLKLTIQCQTNGNSVKKMKIKNSIGTTWNANSGNAVVTFKKARKGITYTVTCTDTKGNVTTKTSPKYYAKIYGTSSKCKCKTIGTKIVTTKVFDKYKYSFKTTTVKKTDQRIANAHSFVQPSFTCKKSTVGKSRIASCKLSGKPKLKNGRYHYSYSCNKKTCSRTAIYKNVQSTKTYCKTRYACWHY